MSAGIVIDACLLSESRRPHPDANVVAWFSRQAPQHLHLTSTGLAELAIGIERLPKVVGKPSCSFWLRDLVETVYRSRILPFGTDAALLLGRMVANAFGQGRPPNIGDAQIAAVAALHGMAVATRDAGDFAAFGVPLVDPWAVPADRSRAPRP